ncbi:hypothetical protein [Cellulomonas shaoxiangyii]|uniref:Uncharacterized protein n=1 Tax=Cellulomonas shaoxiangyii TaxID=2566013 RepID=A0A4P7SKG7_9CELL|nr:hypothetical protein [Cellulomonas shaoxiangyii]QCB94351.1 hypothetical protein E5225_13095 [Cellulomonas shaoxiangyii]TGY85190.1 hypothetical protein E5226_07680 [Cellulomonas shaoxiangyii]
MQPPTTALLARGAATFLLGAVVGVLGTLMHRAIRPWGLVLCVLLVLVAVLTARAWGGWPTYVGAVGGLFLSTQVLAGEGPGGDVLVPGTDLWGWGWLLGALLAVVLVALVPRRWVQDDPAPGGSPGHPLP